MNCILFGLGLHAQRFYLEFLAKGEWIDKVIIVDALTEKARLEDDNFFAAYNKIGRAHV